jgi:hypothetical protein
MGFFDNMKNNLIKNVSSKVIDKVGDYIKEKTGNNKYFNDVVDGAKIASNEYVNYKL